MRWSRSLVCRRALRYAGGTVLLVLGVMMLNPLRNVLIPVWPRVWRDVSTLDVIKMYRVIHASTPLRFQPASCSARTDSQPHPIDVDGELAAYLRAVSRDTTARRDREQEDLNPLPAEEPFFLKPEDVQSEVARLRNVSAAALARATHTQQHVEHWLKQSGERMARFGRFRPLLSPTDTQRAVTLLMTFDLACRAAGVAYVLQAGSLLGWYRHRGFIPWDDDMDVAIHVQQADRAWKVLSCLPGIGLRVAAGAGGLWKLFYLPHHHPNQGGGEEEPGYGFPCIDIFLVTSDARFVWSLAPFAFPKDMTFFRENVIPLTAETFEGVRVLLPRRPRAVCERLYQVDQCVSPEHDHKRGVGLEGSNVTRLPCKHLAGMYTLWNV